MTVKCQNRKYRCVYTVVATEVADLDNPPNSFIINSTNDPIGMPELLGGDSCCVIQQNPGHTNYSAQLAFSLNSNKMAIRHRDGSHVWSAWVYVDFT